MGAPILGQTRPVERMQMDAGMGVTAAIMDMLLHTRRGVNHLFAGAPPSWKQVSFAGLLTAGAFLVSAERANGRVSQVQVHSQVGGCFRLANPWPGAAAVAYAPGREETRSGRILEIETEAGQTVTIRAS
jgi:hypothetical protein